MIEIYKYSPNSTWFEDIINDSTLKGKERDIVIENAIKKHGARIPIVEYFKDCKRNSWFKDYHYTCYGEAENSIERLVNAEINYDEDLSYLSAKNNHPEDLIESRTDWNEMKDYADGLYWFIDSIINDIVIGKVNSIKCPDNKTENAEYVHKDALIKKATEWLYKNQKGFILTDKDITDFVNYMKGE